MERLQILKLEIKTFPMVSFFSKSKKLLEKKILATFSENYPYRSEARDHFAK